MTRTKSNILTFFAFVTFVVASHGTYHMQRVRPCRPGLDAVTIITLPTAADVFNVNSWQTIRRCKKDRMAPESTICVGG